MTNTAATTQLANSMTSALGQPAVQAVVREVKRAELPEARRFDVAVRKASANSLDRLKWLCEVARSKPTAAKVYTAQEALLQMLIKNRDKNGGAKLTRDEFVLVSNRYYNLHLANVPLAVLGAETGVWACAEDIWHYVQELPVKSHMYNNNH